MDRLTAHPPLEPVVGRVGRASFRLIDPGRGDRSLAIDAWYPAAGPARARTSYEVLPGVSFDSAAAEQDADPQPGPFPLILISHGRTGSRFNYSLLCETLAARGAVVVSADHPGDVLSDWLGGTFVDDRTNEVNRVADTRFLLDTLTGPGAADPAGAPAGLTAAIDGRRIATVGHSYGAYSGLAAVAGVRGVPADDRVGAVIGLQPFTRTMSDAALARVRTPTMLVLSEFDTTAPPATDGDRPWGLINAQPAWRVDLSAAAHHASSDMGLYLELAALIPDLPPMVTAYVAMMTPDMVGPHLRAWRDNLVLQIRAVWAFLDVVLEIDPERGEAEARALASEPGVVLTRR